MRRTPLQSSGGSASGADCTGVFAIDFNAWIASGADASLVHGAQVDGEYGYRDPQSPSTTGLSDAIELVVGYGCEIAPGRRRAAGICSRSAMDILLVQPEIPHNTGCAARLAAATGNALHLVEPLGFSLEDRYLKRAGLDYWPQIELVVHASWEAALAALARGSRRPVEERLQLFTARGGTSLFEAAFERDDVLVFGCESVGLPRELLDRYRERRVYVPVRRGVRSLNLANVVCLGVYTAMHRAGVPMPENDGTYEAHPLANEDVWPLARVRRGGDHATPASSRARRSE